MAWDDEETDPWQLEQRRKQLGLPDPAPAYRPDPVGLGPAQADPTQQNYGQQIETHYNPKLFATDQTAQDWAQRLGGEVMSAPSREAGGGTPGSPWNMPDANYVRMPNGSIVNAGQLQQYVDAFGEQAGMKMAQEEVAGSTPQDVMGGGADYWYDQYRNNPAVGAPQGQAQGQAAAPPPVQSSGGSGSVNPAGGIPGGGRTMPPAIPPTAAPPTQGATSTPGGNQQVTADPGSTPYVSPVSRVGGYGFPIPAPMSGGTGAVGAGEWGYDPSHNVQDVLSNDRKYAYTQGGKLLANYGDSMAAQDQRGRQLGSVGDDLYAWMLEHPGYTPEQAKAIMNEEGPGGLKNLRWTDDMANSNFLNSGEQADIKGDPNRASDVYGASVEGLRQGARNYQGQLSGIYDQGATDVNSATGRMSQRLDDSIDGQQLGLSDQYAGEHQFGADKQQGLVDSYDPSKLGLSDEYASQHNFGPEMQQALIEDAGRTVGQGTKAVTDQFQRQAAAAGTNAPLAMSAALDRQRQTGAVASADAMTKAKIQAAQLGLSAGQEKESTRLGAEQSLASAREKATLEGAQLGLTTGQQAETTRLGAAQDLSNRRMQAATTVGQQDNSNQQFLTSGRAAAGLQTGKAELDQSNRIAEQQTGLAGQAEIAQQQRAQAIAQNRQQTNAVNQSSQFTRGSYEDQARSQRETQGATASRNDQTAARQDVRNEEQTAYNESNSRMAGQLQAFGATTGAGQASQQNAITAAQMPSTIQKIIGGVVNGAGQASYGAGGVATEPTMARLGEMGPEIVIKLKPSKPMSYQRRGEMSNAA